MKESQEFPGIGLVEFSESDGRFVAVVRGGCFAAVSFEGSDLGTGTGMTVTYYTSAHERELSLTREGLNKLLGMAESHARYYKERMENERAWWMRRAVRWFGKEKAAQIQRSLGRLS